MSYDETIAYLFGLQKHGIKLGLSNSFLLMDLLGNPQRRFASLHVAGTNGKGSTSAFLASILAAGGRRVGLYTSPHLVSFTERIRINGVPIAESRVVELADRLRGLISGLPDAGGNGEVSPTFFEVTTALAFAYFAEEGIDCAVVEAGMGGRLDSTNVVTPLVSVITNIDLEHTEFLGESIEEIAGEKAGIIKPGVPVVTGAVQQEALGVIEAEALRQGSPVYVLHRDFDARRTIGGREQRMDYRGTGTTRRDLAIGMTGRHQVDNAALALAALEAAGSRLPVSDDALAKGVAGARWEGRLERVSERPDVYLDGAHNPASAEVLADALSEMKPHYRALVLVLGILRDKDWRGIIERLVPLADRVIVTAPSYGRAMDASSLAAQVKQLHGDVASAGTVEQAVRQAAAEAGPGDLVVITGSLYTVGDARAVLVKDAGASLRQLKG